jgi:hypothetical protein
MRTSAAGEEIYQRVWANAVERDERQLSLEELEAGESHTEAQIKPPREICRNYLIRVCGVVLVFLILYFSMV